VMSQQYIGYSVMKDMMKTSTKAQDLICWNSPHPTSLDLTSFIREVQGAPGLNIQAYTREVVRKTNESCLIKYELVIHIYILNCTSHVYIHISIYQQIMHTNQY